MSAFLYGLMGAGIVGAPLIFLLLHFVKEATKERERADSNEMAAKEIKAQSDNLVEHRTDADVVGSLRAKAAAKRKDNPKG